MTTNTTTVYSAKTTRKPLIDLSSQGLHWLGMIFMICDHLWATIIPGNFWLTCVGRLTFPIFAFMLAEGYHYTKNFKKYLGRMLMFAVISEIPFNLTYSGTWIDPFYQNVLWTFVLSLLCMRLLDKIRAKLNIWLAVPALALCTLFFMQVALLTMVDYHHYGLLMVLVFYWFRGSLWWQRLGQLAGLVWINVFMIKGLTFPVELFGTHFEMRQQAFAVLAIIPIWCYHGRRGKTSKFIQYFNYAFYPVHLLILGLLVLLF